MQRAWRPEAVTNEPPHWFNHFPWPTPDAHKHQRGRAVVISGPATKTGAARLAARAALRIGAGLVTIFAPRDALAEHAAQLEAIMLREMPSLEELSAEAPRISACVIGPAAGVSVETRDRIIALSTSGCGPLVIDADAITAFAENPDALFAVTRPQDVLTPHEGEFARLFPDLANDQQDRVARANTAAAQAGCVVLLKGRNTVIAAPDGRHTINETGSPWLATAGSGDVLAGFIGGLLANGMDTFEAAACAAWLHGRLGERLGPGLIADDMPEALPALLNTLAPAELQAKP
jgi:ADP-dependent NAD(P)H-hydrate dehydratase / NAD(P)H-hydrate epimerase